MGEDVPGWRKKDGTEREAGTNANSTKLVTTAEGGESRRGSGVALSTDASVYPHGRNAEEFALMAADGLSPAQALQAWQRGPMIVTLPPQP